MTKIIVFVTLVLVSVGVWYTWNQSNEPAAAEDAEQVEPVAEEQVTENNVYRNEEWGFQFSIPSGWLVKENTFRGYYTQFSAVLVPESGGRKGDPVLIHIVDPFFIKNSFDGLDKSEEDIEIDGVGGVQYTYAWKSDEETVAIVPIKEYQMILGTNGHYPELYEGFLDTFEFIDQQYE